jgi:two-component system, OmpR family, KDP operon response regulator KdpE
MTNKLHAAKTTDTTRNAIIEKAVLAGFGRAVVPALLDFLIEELSESPEVIRSRRLSNGPLSLDLDMREATLDDSPVFLTPVEFRLVEYFMRKVGVVVPNRVVLRDLWGPSAEGQAQYLRVYVGQLRRKLGPDVIKTKVGEGYYMPSLPGGGVA